MSIDVCSITQQNCIISAIIVLTRFQIYSILSNELLTFFASVSSYVSLFLLRWKKGFQAIGGNTSSVLNKNDHTHSAVHFYSRTEVLLYKLSQHGSGYSYIRRLTNPRYVDYMRVERVWKMTARVDYRELDRIWKKCKWHLFECL